MNLFTITKDINDALTSHIKKIAPIYGPFKTQPFLMNSATCSYSTFTLIIKTLPNTNRIQIDKIPIDHICICRLWIAYVIWTGRGSTKSVTNKYTYICRMWAKRKKKTCLKIFARKWNKMLPWLIHYCLIKCRYLLLT